MSDDHSGFGFARFVPGFDFLQNLAGSAVKGATSQIPGLAALPQLTNWVAPTLNVEELEKRIAELKAVQFWLDQNAHALKATIQALEVQKMTLATLKGMNLQFADVANAFKIKAGDLASVPPATAASTPVAPPPPPPAPAPPPPAPAAAAEPPAAPRKAAQAEGSTASMGLIDPMQWWGALSQQFQNIAANAVKEASKQSAADATRQMAAELTQASVKAASGMANALTGNAAGKAMQRAADGQAKGPAAKKAAPRKAPVKKAPAKRTGAARKSTR
jgi:hypothetical protein